MAKCGECNNEKLMCVCPKGLGGGDGDSENEAFDSKADQVASAIIQQCVNLQHQSPEKATEFINKVRDILDNDIANPFIEQLTDGISPESKVPHVKKIFKMLQPNKPMLEALSDKLNLDVLPNPANKFNTTIKQTIDALGYMPPYPEVKEQSFEKALQSYAAYSQNDKLTPPQKLILPVVFWSIIKQLGTPIIEKGDRDNVKVHFLFPKSGYKSADKNLYVAGDYHGFTSTNEAKQAMKALGTTGIMYRCDEIPKDSVITYNFVQVDKAFADQDRPFFSGPSEALPSNFYPSNFNDPSILEFEAPTANNGSSPFEGSELPDNYSKHASVTCCAPGMSMVCANADNDLSGLRLSPINWAELLSSRNSQPASAQRLKHKDSFLCTSDDNLINDSPIDDGYFNRVLSDQKNTRAINVFEPISGNCEHLLVVNDGIGYMATDMVERLDDLIRDGKIPENTAVIFITALPGLANKYSQKVGSERAIEYGSKIEEYSQFLSEKLLPKLDYKNIPIENQTIMGSSMSGTASIYMGMPHKSAGGKNVPAPFGHVIAQAPSYSNRQILDPIIEQRRQDRDNGTALDLSKTIKLSCGKFDSLDHAKNLNWDHTQELAKVLGTADKQLPVLTGNYGHLIHCWSKEVATTLPNIYSQPTLSEEAQFKPT